MRRPYYPLTPKEHPTMSAPDTKEFTNIPSLMNVLTMDAAELATVMAHEDMTLELLRDGIIAAARDDERERLRLLSVDGTEALHVLTEDDLMQSDVSTTEGMVPAKNWRAEVFEHIKVTRRALEERIVRAERARAAVGGGIRTAEVARALAEAVKKACV